MKKVFALLMAAAMILSLAACGNKNPDSNPDSNDDSNDKKTTLILGTSADYAPFEFMYPDDKGELTYAGIDVSVAQYIADDMGLSLQVENMAFEYLLTSLGKGDFDMVLAAMEATPDRLENADFSDPYYNDIPPAILVKADNADQFKTLADFAGKSVGAQAATTKLDIIADSMPGANAVSLQSVLDLINDLTYGKVDAIVRILNCENYERVICFCNTKGSTERLTKFLQLRGLDAQCIHGDIPQRKREEVMARFRDGQLRVFVATDVASRGIDVDDVDAVFNFEVPEENEYYIHRIGRTGRAKKHGVAYTLLSDFPSRMRLDDIARNTRSQIIPATLEEDGRVTPAEPKSK